MSLDPLPALLTITQAYSETPVPIGGTAAGGEPAGHRPGPPARSTAERDPAGCSLLRSRNGLGEVLGVLGELWSGWDTPGLGHEPGQGHAVIPHQQRSPWGCSPQSEQMISFKPTLFHTKGQKTACTASLLCGILCFTSFCQRHLLTNTSENGDEEGIF